MSSQQHYKADQTGERIDAFLGRIASEHSRSYWQKLCDDGRVAIASHRVTPNTRLRAGEVVTVDMPKNHHAPQKLPIIYEDADVIVISKPAGLLTHAKVEQHTEFTVAEFVRPHTADNIHSNRPGIVHRLDRGTSGVIIAAKNSAARQWLQAQFSKRNVKKTYIALVEGHVNEQEAILRLPIERNPKRPQTFRVGANGRPAETAYQLSKRFTNNDLLTLRPLTGRTHQLRVHLAYIGHPIVGDTLYGQPNETLGRLFLHAQALELTLPSGERKTFTASLPSELQNFLYTLQ